MTLQLKRPLVIFDLETTGINVSADRIIELAYIKIFPDGKKEEAVMRFNPGIPIPPEATAIHNITDSDVADKPSFASKANDLSNIFKGCDFGGFNSNKFDFPMLVEEFLRASVEFDVEQRKFIDAQRIFHIMEQRTLTAAYKFYCDKDLVDAHAALADTRATYEVLMAQLSRYPQLQNDVDFIHQFTGQSKNFDLAGRMIYNEKKEVVFNFGKHKGKSVEAVLKAEPSYYEWMMQGDFPEDTKRRLTQLRLKGFGNK